MALASQGGNESKLSGKLIISELLRNMELGRFEMTYSVLLPCVFTIYLNPEDHASLKGVFPLVIEDARRSLRARAAQLNAHPANPVAKLALRRTPGKEHKIACPDWMIEFFPDGEVPVGDVEIHSELSEAPEPGYRGTKTTLLERAPSASAGATQRTEAPRPQPASVERRDVASTLAVRPPLMYAEIRYQDETGAQTYSITQNQVRIGRGGDDLRVDLVLATGDEVSREHLQIWRDSATGNFFVKDLSTNGTWLNRKRLRKGVDEALPNKAEIGLAEVLTLTFEQRS